MPVTQQKHYFLILLRGIFKNEGIKSTFKYNSDNEKPIVITYILQTPLPKVPFNIVFIAWLAATTKT